MWYGKKNPKGKDPLLVKIMENKLLASKVLLQYRALQPGNDNGETVNCENDTSLILFNSLLKHIIIKYLNC